MDMSGDPKTENDHDRVTARESIFMAATVLFAGARFPEPVRVRNISSGGMMIDTTVQKPEGLKLVAEIKNVGKVRGHVAWSTEKRTGIAFDTAIDPLAARQRPDASVIQPTFKRPYHETGRPGLSVK